LNSSSTSTVAASNVVMLWACMKRAGCACSQLCFRTCFPAQLLSYPAVMPAA
jgi:hypothetical protein